MVHECRDHCSAGWTLAIASESPHTTAIDRVRPRAVEQDCGLRRGQRGNRHGERSKDPAMLPATGLTENCEERRRVHCVVQTDADFTEPGDDCTA